MIQGGVIRGGVVFFVDITERKRLEELREQYIHSISHDLRNPLTIIQGQAQLLQLTARKSGVDTALQRGAEAIVTTAKRMNVMIQDLFDVARIESGQLRVDTRPLNLRSLCLLLDSKALAQQLVSS